ncbi:MAG TPA: chemotaxis protein CheB [Roseiarcus sp.]|nr:chemotaxis protein CheB [Roseiarcus sp.]
MSEPAPKAVAIGASAGAVEALSAILPRLPTDFGLPVIVVVHIPPDKKSLMAEVFRMKCEVDVREAEDKEPLVGGVVYFAPPDYHLLIEPDGAASLSNDEPVLFSRPSIDVMFESAADAYGPNLIAIVLTGANQDGAKGLRAVAEAGGTAIVQTPQSAFAPMMPQSALAEVPGALVLSLNEIALYLRGADKR